MNTNFSSNKRLLKLPRKSRILRLQCSTLNENVKVPTKNTKSSPVNNKNQMLCVEVSDDSEPEEIKEDSPRISIQIRQSTNVNPVDRELLKCLNAEFMNVMQSTSNGSRRSGSDHHTVKRPKISETVKQNVSLLPPNNNKHLMSSSESDYDEKSDQDEVIELESLSSHNRNTRIKSNESSSGIRVSSSSSKNTPRRRILKNTVPADSFERYLSGITKKYRELTHRDRVIIWDFSMDVSDVEDYVQYEEKFERYKESKKFENRNNFMDNNNIEASCSTKNNCKYENNIQQKNETQLLKFSQPTNLINKVPSGELLTIPSSESSSEIDDFMKEERILISINTETKEIYKNDAILIGSDDSHKTSSSLNLKWSEEESGFKNNRLNPEIDKISRLIQQTNILKKHNADLKKSKHFEMINIENQENFKIPNVPRKYLPGKMDVSQKEEFYKYLGLGTKSPNGKCEDDIDQHHDIKRRSLRVRRLQLQQSPINQSNHAHEENKHEDQKEIK